MADPKPVRRQEGRVPRQKEAMALGAEAISRMVRRRVVDEDCWTRVLRRSAGWRSTAEKMPDVRPARKWNAYEIGMSAFLFCCCPLDSPQSNEYER